MARGIPPDIVDGEDDASVRRFRDYGPRVVKLERQRLFHQHGPHRWPLQDSSKHRRMTSIRGADADDVGRCCLEEPLDRVEACRNTPALARLRQTLGIDVHQADQLCPGVMSPRGGMGLDPRAWNDDAGADEAASHDRSPKGHVNDSFSISTT